MNRFDRITSLLLLLHTRSVVTAQFLSEYFAVSERTIYRDIRTLENAGVPIASEAGVGYFLEKGYRLPPVSFSLDEASALLLGEKLLVASLDEQSLHDYSSALNKVRAVIDRTDKDKLSALDDDVTVMPTGSHFPVDDVYRAASDEAASPSSSDRWLRECRSALLRSQVIELNYAAQSGELNEQRLIEPIGLFYYGWHWHLIAWCRMRQAYRDFRLDRISRLSLVAEQFSRRSRLTLQQYLDERPERESFTDVKVRFSEGAARFVEAQRYLFGFVAEHPDAGSVVMHFLTPVPEYMARWLLQYLDEIEIIQGDTVKTLLSEYAKRLYHHWQNS